jgi:peptidoglycan/xylan/chitin deacetylase (PgdA/CDA1 family)
MRRVTAIAGAFAFCASVSAALAGQCTNPNALGTSRTLVIDNTSHMRLGAQQYNETLPLADREVVITFDDGPLGPYTTRILDLLAAECVKATYFLVGTMAQANPALVQRIQKEGHTVGTHSRNHPLTFHQMPLATAEREIDGGIALVKAALGEQGQLAPFFRIPGLNRTTAVENALAARSLVTWSVDLVADDWHRGITADEIAKRALRRLDERGRGILLLHDIHPATALAMPAILKGLKARGFRVVHVVPAAPGRPKTASEPQQWAAHGKRFRIVVAEGGIDTLRPVLSRSSMDIAMQKVAVVPPAEEARYVLATAGDDLRVARDIWPDGENSVRDAAPIPITIEGPPSLSLAQPSLASLAVTEDATWPAVRVRPQRTAEPKKETSKQVTQRKKPERQQLACRNRDRADKAGAARSGARCKPASGHQLSLSGEVPPSSLRSQYSF